MVGVSVDASRVLDERQLAAVVERALGAGWKPERLELRRAAEGLTGFLGQHFRATLRASPPAPHTPHTDLQLFIKRVPIDNQAKADFIEHMKVNKREALLYRLFDELGGADGPNPWRPPVYYCDETVLVMPDLSLDGFAPRHYLSTLQLPDALLAVASVARFHAAFADYTTRKSAELKRPFNFENEHQYIMSDPVFCDSPYVRSGAKLSANLLKKFSDKYEIPDLESKIGKLYVDACDSLRCYPETLNVIVHKDLWLNNIMFAPGKAVIVDYQCVRYGPPAFDLMLFLYLCTTREFREAHEKEVFLHYYSVFTKSISEKTAQRLKELGYDCEQFLEWCERGRMFGMFYGIAIAPYIFMEPTAAALHFDDPDTWEEYSNVDRTKPVLEYAAESPKYLDRQMKITEEFADRYLPTIL